MFCAYTLFFPHTPSPKTVLLYVYAFFNMFGWNILHIDLNYKKRLPCIEDKCKYSVKFYSVCHRNTSF